MSGAPDATRETSQDRYRERTFGLLGDGALLLLLTVAYGWLFVFFPAINNPNELVRLYTARAMVEQHTYSIGTRTRLPDGRLDDRGPLFAAWGYVNDKSLVCDDPAAAPPNCAGRLYAAKAPATSWLEAPVVLAVDAAFRRTGHAPSKDDYIFWCRWLVVILPTVVFWVLLRRFLLGLSVEPALAQAAVLAGALGSLSLTYGQMAAGHQLAALSLGFALVAGFARRGRGRAGEQPAEVTHRGDLRSFAVGFFLALSVACEYPSAPAAALLGLGWLGLRRPSWRDLLAAALGAALPALLLLHFHHAAFGSPFSTPYNHLENQGFVRDMAPGLMGVSLPTFEKLWGGFFSPTLGLFFWSPWCALAVPAGLALLSGARSERRRTSTDPGSSPPVPAVAIGALCALVVGYYCFFQLSHALWRSGWTVGPRYITPLVPFAAVTVALWAQRFPAHARPIAAALLGGTGAASVLATGLASAVCQGFPFEAYNPLPEIVLPLLSHGWLPRNPLQALGVPGLLSGLPYFAALGIACALLLWTPLFAGTAGLAGHGSPGTPAWKTGPDAFTGHVAEARRAGLWRGLVLLLLLAVGQWTASAGTTAEGPKGAAFLSTQWAPRHPPGAHEF
jgi:hypothetical protein